MFTNLMNREANESHYISLFAAGFIDAQAVCSIAQSLGVKKVFTFLPEMIPTQVHLRRPCYDFSFLQTKRFNWFPLPCGSVRQVHLFVPSVGATGGVYKRQGRNQCGMMNHAY